MLSQDDLIRQLEEELPTLKADLNAMESGTATTGQGSGLGWVDTTADEIKWCKRTIAMYEGILDDFRARPKA